MTHPTRLAPRRARRRLSGAAAFVAAAVVLAGAACARRDAGGARDSASSSSAAAAGSTSSGVTRGDDLQRLQDFTLTMPKMDQWYAAMRNVASVAKTHPELRDRFASDGSLSIDQETARIEAMPEFRKAINDAGMSVRDFEMVMWTTLQAGMAQGAIDAGANRDSVLRSAGVNPENLAFLKAHGAELQVKQKQMEKDIGTN